MKSKITNISDNFVFMKDVAREHPGPAYVRDFARMSFGKLMMLLIACIWNAYLFQFLAWLTLLFKNILLVLTRKFIEIAAREKRSS